MPDISIGPREASTQEAREGHADETSLVGGEDTYARDLLRLARRLTGICGRMFLSNTSPAPISASAESEVASPKCLRTTRSWQCLRSCYSLLRDLLFPLLAHVPNVDVIMGLIESRMTGIEVDGYVVPLSGEAFKIESFSVLKVLDGEHVDRAAQSALAVESTVWSVRERVGLNVKRADAGEEGRKIYE